MKAFDDKHYIEEWENKNFSGSYLGLSKFASLSCELHQR